MVENETLLRNRADAKIWRVCDECQQRDEVFMNTVVRGRLRRHQNIDLCKRCAASPKYKRTVFSDTGEKSVNWKGGIRKNNGYEQVYVGGGAYRCTQRYVAEQTLGRPLTATERVHHINMQKDDNRPCNLFVCGNRAEHMKCHASMESLAYTMLGNSIWFNAEQLQYTCNRVEDRVLFIDISDLLSLPQRKAGSANARTRYVSVADAHGNNIALHRLVAEQIIGRRLYADEHVHHIDGNGLNNIPNNLIVLTPKQHKDIHHSLQRCISHLLIQGKVFFESGEYFRKVA